MLSKWTLTLILPLIVWEAPRPRIGDAKQEIWNETMRTLETSEETRRLIKRLHWYGSTSHAERLGTLVDMLALLPTLGELSLSDWIWEATSLGRNRLTFRTETITILALRTVNYPLVSQFEQHLALFPCCISMDFDTISWPKQDSSRWVQAFPRTLRRLSAQWMDFVVLLERILRVRPSIQLTSLRLAPLYIGHMRAVHQLPQQAGSAMTDLSIGFDDISNLQPLNVDPYVNLTIYIVDRTHRR